MAQLSQATVYSNERVSAFRNPVGRDRDTYDNVAYTCFVSANVQAGVVAGLGVVGLSSNSADVYLDSAEFSALLGGNVVLTTIPLVGSIANRSAYPKNQRGGTVLNIGRIRTSTLSLGGISIAQWSFPAEGQITYRPDNPFLLSEGTAVGFQCSSPGGAAFAASFNLRVVT